jgi:hypothetical protein
MVFKQAHLIQHFVGRKNNMQDLRIEKQPTRRHKAYALFVWLISHQPAVLFSQNKPATSNQPAVLFSQNKSAPAISHQPNEQADRLKCCMLPNLPVQARAGRSRKHQSNTELPRQNDRFRDP